MIRRILLVLTALAAMPIQSTQAEAVASWPEDFHSTSAGPSDGTHGWWYRQAQIGKYESDSATNALVGSGPGYVSPDGVSIWKGGGVPGGWGLLANIRWVSSVTGPVTIEGSFNKTQSDGGNGIKVFIQINGVEQWSETIDALNTEEVPFKVTASLKSGDQVDFLVSPNGTDCDWDNFDFNATIISDTKPSAP